MDTSTSGAARKGEACFGTRPAEDRRGAARRRTFRTASIVFNDGRSTVDATVRDISDSGARLRVQGAFDCPREIILRFADGTAHNAELRWFRHLELGLRFTGEAWVMGAASPSVLRVWALYREIEKLSPANVLRDLRVLHFLGDPEVEALAADWMAAHERLLDKLRPRRQPRPEETP